jgi:hypothetical protein
MASSNNDSSNASAAGSSKRSAADLGEEERAPKRIKAMEPDLTVVVKGVEFYHYKLELCMPVPSLIPCYRQA